jgi:hypothetical protein
MQYRPIFRQERARWIDYTERAVENQLDDGVGDAFGFGRRGME